MRILLTNDDGINAAGLNAARRSLERCGDVWVIAPEKPRSAAGHAITLHKPLRINPWPAETSVRTFSVSGTPSDCVTLGHDVIMNGDCDIVVSGINHGTNLGWDLTYSGTVSAAMEGAVIGLPSIAISQEVVPGHPKELKHDFEAAGDLLVMLVKRLVDDPLPPFTLLNVNVPFGAVADKFKITCQGTRVYLDRFAERLDPSGRPYYWITGHPAPDDDHRETDVNCLKQGITSVTPVQLDMTAYNLIEKLKGWQQC